LNACTFALFAADASPATIAEALKYLQFPADAMITSVSQKFNLLYA